MPIIQAVGHILVAHKYLIAQCAKSLTQSKKCHIKLLLWAYISSGPIDPITPLIREWRAYEPHSWQSHFWIIPDTQYWWNKFVYKASKTDFYYNQRKATLTFYVLRTLWRLKMHKRQKDVREKKMKLYFLYYVTLFLSPWHYLTHMLELQ